jgi:hypothetical protein
MYLRLYVDTDTMKKNWDYSKCDSCACRFECYTEDIVTVQPFRIERMQRDYTAEFHLPLCIRTGLFKQISDTGFWCKNYDTPHTDGFKLGAVFGDEREVISLHHSWVRLPNILYVAGTSRKRRK